MSYSQARSASAFEVSSSPDPLNDTLADHRSFITSSPSKRRSSQTSNKRHGRNSSQGSTSSTISSKQNLQSPISPSRTVTEQTLSPWKIRVTVEAEPEDTELAGKVKTYTQTTTIPLRGESSPVQIPNVTTGRGRRSGSQSRARAGSASSTKSRQRSTTPKAGRTRRQSVTNLDIVVWGDDGDEDEWGKKPCKRSPRKSNPASRRTMDKSKDNNKSTDLASSEFTIQADVYSDDERSAQDASQSRSPELREIDLNKVAVRPRANSAKHKISTIGDSERPLRSTEGEEDECLARENMSRKVSANSTRSYPTPSPTPSDSESTPGISLDKDEGFDTIIESEGFTMIDLDSIPSARQLKSSPAEQETEGNEEDPGNTERSTSQPIASQQTFTTTPGKPFPSYLHLAEGESDISSAMPSSPPLPTSQLKASHHQSSLGLQIPSSSNQSRGRTVTPLTYSSPKLPSPPRATPAKNRPTPDSSQAVKVGLILQDTIEPRHVSSFRLQTPEAQKSAIPKDQNISDGNPAAELFGGFDSGTQRELRAGLRFGEELSKRQQPSSSIPGAEQTDISQFQIWRAEPVISKSPQPCKKPTLKGRTTSFGSLQSSSRRPSTLSQMTNLSDLSSPSEKQPKPKPDDQFQHQEIQDVAMEDAESVSDEDEDEDEDGDEADIWLAEAKQCSSSPSGSDKESDNSSTSNNLRQPVLVKNLAETSDTAHASSLQGNRECDVLQQTDLSGLTSAEGDSSISGLFWKPQREQQADIRFGAGQIKDARRELRVSGQNAFSSARSSGKFDVEKMLGTPKRIRDSLKDDNAQPQLLEQEVGVENGDEASQASEESSLFDQPQTIPVNFHDSTISDAQETPYKTRISLSPSRRRPLTPRSAIKGSRQSFGLTNAVESADDSDREERRVVWARKSNHMNEDWIESSRSIHSDGSSVIQAESIAQEEESPEIDPTTSGSEQDLTPTPMPAAQPEAQLKKNGWFNWLGSDGEKGRDNSNVLAKSSDTGSQHSLQMEESSDGLHEYPGQPSTEPSIQYREQPTMKLVHRSSTTGPMSRKLALPSFLNAPSYPSDPKRSTSTPLSTSGEFSNTHFRTLHIIYAKSSRPRFHAPQVEDCRPEIRRLVTDKWQMYIDEDRAGMGGFSFKFGEREGRVLERFCREIEWGYLHLELEHGEISLQDIFASPYGIWGGASHGQSNVEWGWACEELAERLGRIIVGEVVRTEEFGGKKT